MDYSQELLQNIVQNITNNNQEDDNNTDIELYNIFVNKIKDLLIKLELLMDDTIDIRSYKDMTLHLDKYMYCKNKIHKIIYDYNENIYYKLLNTHHIYIREISYCIKELEKMHGIIHT